MSMQSVFDTILTGLRKQGRQSRDPMTSGCRYLAKNGDKCAVGILVPDGIKLKEKTGVGYQSYAHTAFLTGLMPEVRKQEALRFLVECQGAHDVESLKFGWLPAFEARMATVASDFDLKYEAS